MLIKRVIARKISDSRGEETIEIEIEGCKASSPSGKSKGKFETPPYKDSIDWNIDFINKTEFNLEIKSFKDLKKLENFIEKKAKIKDAKQFGANALFALESATLKALAKKQNKELWQIIDPKARKFPFPVGNAIGGGLHSHNESAPIFQEFLLIPEKDSFQKNVELMQNIYEKLPKLFNAKGKNDEGAWQVDLTNEQVLGVISKFKEAGWGIDAAASSFFINKSYQYGNMQLDSKLQIYYINDLIKKFNLKYIEDPLQEEDFSGFKKIIRNKKILVVGDDLTVTHIDRVKKAIKMKSINAVIIKPNQNGSLIELDEIFKICKKNKIKTVVSHRSGETMDDALADIAFGFQADYIKCGISTKWREVKIKRMCEIETNLKNKSTNPKYRRITRIF